MKRKRGLIILAALAAVIAVALIFIDMKDKALPSVSVALHMVKAGDSKQVKKEGDRKQTLIVANDSMEGIVNPFFATMPGDDMINQIVYEPLAKQDETGIWTNVLAEEVAVAEDGSLIEIRLKERLEFSDSSPVGAEDVMASVAGMCSRSVKYSLDDIYRNIRGMDAYGEDSRQGIDGLELVDERTVRIHFAVRSYDNIQILNTLIAKGDFADFTEGEDPVAALGEYRDTGIGTGAYMPVGGSSNTLVELIANPNYRGEIKDIKKIKFIYINFYEYEDFLANGQVDVVLYNRYSELFDSIYKAGQFHVYEKPTSELYYIGFNTDRGYLADTALRQAIFYSIDRGALAGASDILLMPVGTLALPNSVYEENAVLEQDVKRAKALMEKYGEMELVLPIVKGKPIMEHAVSVLERDLKKIGIRLDVQVYDTDDSYLNDVFISKKFDLLLYSEPVDMTWQSFQSLLNDRYALPIGINNKEFQTETDKLLQIYKPEDGYAQFRKLNSMLGDAAPIIPYARGVNYMSVSADLSGYSVNAYSNFLENIHNIQVN